MRCLRLSLCLLVFSAAPGVLNAQTGEEKAAVEVEIDLSQQMAFGVYGGFNRAPLEIHPRESQQSVISEPWMVTGGISLFYRFSFLFARAAIDGSKKFAGGQGNFTGDVSAETYNILFFHIPITAGFVFPLSEESRVFFGFGPSILQGTVSYESDSFNDSYEFNAQGLHFAVGSEFQITESIALQLLWMHTSGMTGALAAGSATTKEREFSLRTDQIQLEMKYYFL